MSIVETTPTIVHESERQRQYARLRVPLSIKIAGRRYDIIDWSVGGMSIQAEDLNLTVGNTYSGRIVLAFEDFEVDLKVRFEVCYIDAESGRMGCRLVEQTTTQLAMLQYLVRAHVAGEIVHMDDIMNVVQRGDPVSLRTLPQLSPRESARLRLRRWVIGGSIVLAFLAMLTLLIGSVYERLYVVNARSAVVTTNLVEISAPQGGRLAYGADVADGTASAGGLLATVTTPGGATYFVESPCNCRIVDVLSTEDSQVGVGTSLMLLAPEDAVVIVSALVPYEDALRLRNGIAVALSYTGADGSFQGTIEKVDIRRQLSALGQPLLDVGSVVSAEITIMPDRPLPLEWIGMPVAVTIDLFPTTWLGQLVGVGE